MLLQNSILDGLLSNYYSCFISSIDAGSTKRQNVFQICKKLFSRKNPQLSNNQKVLSGYVKIHKINIGDIAGKKVKRVNLKLKIHEYYFLQNLKHLQKYYIYNFQNFPVLHIQ